MRDTAAGETGREGKLGRAGTGAGLGSPGQERRAHGSHVSHSQPSRELSKHLEPRALRVNGHGQASDVRSRPRHPGPALQTTDRSQPIASVPAAPVAGATPPGSAWLHNTPQGPEMPSQVWAHSKAVPVPFLEPYARKGTRKRGVGPPEAPVTPEFPRTGPNVGPPPWGRTWRGLVPDLQAALPAKHPVPPERMGGGVRREK